MYVEHVRLSPCSTGLLPSIRANTLCYGLFNQYFSSGSREVDFWPVGLIAPWDLQKPAVVEMVVFLWLSWVCGRLTDTGGPWPENF